MTIEYKNIKDLNIARENTRKTRPSEQVKTLAASIEAIGILHTLVGYEKKGKVYITDGGSRLAALRLIAKGKTDTGALLTKIPVNICGKDHAIDVSLSANLVRSAMTPADQFTAFHKLHHLENVPVDEIAKRYYVDSATVKRILKLAALAKPIFKAFRDGDISLDAAKVYAGCGDIDRQLNAFDECGVDASVHAIRVSLRRNTYLADAARVAFVGLQNYRDKGGVLEDDLFEDKTILLNGEIIDELMGEAIQSHTQSLLDDGWSFVEYFEDSQDYFEATKKFSDRLWQTCCPTKAQQSKMDKLSSQMEKLGAYWQLEDDERTKYDKWEATYKALEQAASSFSKDEMAQGVCLWYFGESGAQYATFALPQEKSKSEKDKQVQRDYPESFERNVLASAGDALMEHLTNHPHAVTTALTIAALEFANFPTVNLSLKQHPKLKFTRGEEKAESSDGLDGAYDYSGWNINPTDMIKRVKELVAMSEPERQSVLASLLRKCLTMSEQSSDQSDRLDLLHYVSGEAEFTLTDYWTFGEDELKCLTKKQLIHILETMGLSPKSFDKAKKSELVTVAARYAAEQNWTPEFVRGEKMGDAVDGSVIPITKAA